VGEGEADGGGKPKTADWFGAVQRRQIAAVPRKLQIEGAAAEEIRTVLLSSIYPLLLHSLIVDVR
jgi:hypothetical protein